MTLILSAIGFTGEFSQFFIRFIGFVSSITDVNDKDYQIALIESNVSTYRAFLQLYFDVIFPENNLKFSNNYSKITVDVSYVLFFRYFLILFVT